MLELPHVVFAVNKMDLVAFSEERFAEICGELDELTARLGLHDPRAIPISALRGDNVVDASEAMPWWDGPPLLEHLEGVDISVDRNLAERRLPVQWVIRPMSDEHHDYRGYAGAIAGGTWRPGDDVVVLPSGLRSRVAAVEVGGAEVDAAAPPMSVTVRLDDDVDVARGDMLADPEQPPAVTREILARVCWMSERPLAPRARLLLKHTTRTVPALASELLSKVEIHTLGDLPSPELLELNDLGRVRFRLGEPLAVDAYPRNRATGAFIAIDEATNDTVAAGMIEDAVA